MSINLLKYFRDTSEKLLINNKNDSINMQNVVIASVITAVVASILKTIDFKELVVNTIKLLKKLVEFAIRSDDKRVSREEEIIESYNDKY
ncbi:MAG: hypothetical protein KAH32_05305 [Chlamydiia bacterium]|nr:hypothetical protein [Chlamydiia bacterium]